MEIMTYSEYIFGTIGFIALLAIIGMVGSTIFAHEKSIKEQPHVFLDDSGFIKFVEEVNKCLPEEWIDGYENTHPDGRLMIQSFLMNWYLTNLGVGSPYNTAHQAAHRLRERLPVVDE